MPLAAQDFLVKEAQHPLSVSSLADGTLQADFGRVAFGQLDIRLTSLTGRDTVVLHLGERAIDGRIWRTPTTTVRYRRQVLPLQKGTHTYSFTIEPDKRNTGRDAIKMPAAIGEVLPFRWLEVENYGRKLRAKDIVRYAVHVPFRDDAADFRCSNDTLNRLWDLCKYTVKATSFTGYYVDGDRERIPYEADALINQLCHYGADTSFEPARRTLAHLLEHPTWPTEWILQAIPIAWNDWMFSGDDSFVHEHYALLKARTLLALRTDNGLISTTTGLQTPEFLASINRTAPIRDIVDWPHTGGTGLAKGQGGEDDGYVYTDCNTVVNAWFYHALVLMEEMARHLGYSEDSATFKDAAAKVKEVFDNQLYDPARGVYVDGLGTDHAALHANMFPLLFGLVPPERQEGVVAFIRSRGMACSVYGAQFLLDALYQAGEADYALSLLTSDSLRSWYNMLRVGSTLTLEAWDDSFKPNQDWNHAWGAAPGNILPFRLMGFQPLDPSCTRVRIHPQLASLKWARATIPTALGPVRIRVRSKASGSPVPSSPGSGSASAAPGASSSASAALGASGSASATPGASGSASATLNTRLRVRVHAPRTMTILLD